MTTKSFQTHNLKVVGSNPTPATTDNAAKLLYINDVSAFIVSDWFAEFRAGNLLGITRKQSPDRLGPAGHQDSGARCSGDKGKGRWCGAIRCCRRAECRRETPVWLEGLLPH